MVLWVSPRSGNGDGLQTLLPALVVLVLLVVLLSRPQGERVAAESPA
jgi:preprotein translocase subunit YajC